MLGVRLGVRDRDRFKVRVGLAYRARSAHIVLSKGSLHYHMLASSAQRNCRACSVVCRCSLHSVDR